MFFQPMPIVSSGHFEPWLLPGSKLAVLWPLTLLLLP